MTEKKISLREAFDRVFGTEDKYFGEWFLKSDESFTEFLEKGLTAKEIFFKQLCYLYLYFESLDVLKKQAAGPITGMAGALSKETWYCCVLLLLVGLIDQHTKKELNDDGTIKNQKKRFQIVMNSLSEAEKQHMLKHYGENKHQQFDDLTSHLYATRNFFAHEIILPEEAIPQDGYLGHSSKKPGFLFPNMPHGMIFLYTIIALVRYLGFTGKIDVVSNKKFQSLVDMFRHA